MQRIQLKKIGLQKEPTAEFRPKINNLNKEPVCIVTEPPISLSSYLYSISMIDTMKK